MWDVFLVLFWSRKPYLTSKTIFGTQLAPPDPSLGGSKGVLGVKIRVEGYRAWGVSFEYYFSQGGKNWLQRHLLGPNWPPKTLPWEAQKGSRGSKLKLKHKCHVGCLFSTFLVKEVVIDFKTSFGNPTGPPRPFLGGALKGSRGS